jgi:hypothetical protein
VNGDTASGDALDEPGKVKLAGTIGHKEPELYLNEQVREELLLRLYRRVVREGLLAALLHRVRVEIVMLGHHPRPFLTVVFCSMKRRCRTSAIV